MTRLGLSYHWAGRYDEAIERYNRALALDPKFDVATLQTWPTLISNKVVTGMRFEKTNGISNWGRRTWSEREGMAHSHILTSKSVILRRLAKLRR